MADEYSGEGNDKDKAREELFKAAGEGANLSGRVHYEVSVFDSDGQRVSGKKNTSFERAYASAFKAAGVDPDSASDEQTEVRVQAYGTFEKAVVKAAEPVAAGRPSGADRSRAKTSELTDMF